MLLAVARADARAVVMHLCRTVFAFKWLRHFGSKDQSPALWQIASHSKVWLIALLALLLATVGLRASSERGHGGRTRALRSWARALMIVGAAGGSLQ